MGDEKDIFRKKALERVRNIGRSRSYRIDKTMFGLLRDEVKKRGASSVMLYYPLSGEVDTVSLIGWLRRRGVGVYLPFMLGKSFILVKYRLPMIKKRFGIYEPKISGQYRKRKIDMAIVPVVGIDSTFRRVGFGRGMYDRFFEKEKRNIEYILFVQRILCVSGCRITDDYDMEADAVASGGVEVVKTDGMDDREVCRLGYAGRRVLSRLGRGSVSRLNPPLRRRRRSVV